MPPQCKIFCSSCVKCATSVERVVCTDTCRFPVQLAAVSFVALYTLLMEMALKIPTTCRSGFFAYCRPNIFRFCSPKGTGAGLNYSWSHLIYLLHLASINCFKSQVTSLFNTSAKVQLPPSVMARGPHPTC